MLIWFCVNQYIKNKSNKNNRIVPLGREYYNNNYESALNNTNNVQVGNYIYENNSNRFHNTGEAIYDEAPGHRY